MVRSLLVLALFLSGCTSVYRGPPRISAVVKAGTGARHNGDGELGLLCEWRSGASFELTGGRRVRIDGKGTTRGFPEETLVHFKGTVPLVRGW